MRSGKGKSRKSLACILVNQVAGMISGHIDFVEPHFRVGGRLGVSPARLFLVIQAEQLQGVRRQHIPSADRIRPNMLSLRNFLPSFVLQYCCFRA